MRKGRSFLAADQATALPDRHEAKAHVHEQDAEGFRNGLSALEPLGADANGELTGEP